MAAALRQYQACLGIMVRLQVEDLTALKREFDAADRGLCLYEFVSVMLDHVSAWDETNAVQFIEDLVELFAQVDVNGDGTMEWEEFTSAIIEGGMGTMADDLDWRDLQYEENTTFADVLNRPPKRVQYLSEFKRLLVYDNTRPVVEIVDPMALYPLPIEATMENASKFDPDGSDPVYEDGGHNSSGSSPTLAIINKFHPLCYIVGYRRDQDDVRSERSPVQALKYLSKVDLLAVSGGDLKLTFWASTILTASSTSALETPLPLAIVHTPRPQRVLEWNPVRHHLYSISADLVITVWHVLREKSHDSKGRCEVSFVTTLKQHTDLLQDLLLLNNEMLVSCGMDNMIYLWDTETLQVRTTRQGHRRGVRLLTKLSNQLFLSAGFECEVLGWDIGALATAPVFKLWGHNAPVCCIQLIQSAAFVNQSERRGSSLHVGADMNGSAIHAASLLADQALTVDDDGWFKWWNLANITSMENNDLEQNSNRCLQTFRLGSDKYPWKAHSLSVLNNGQSVLAAGIHKLKLLQRVRLKPKVLPSAVVQFNSVSFTLLTTTDREIRIWDATSGILLRTFHNISSSDISCVDLDARQRKIVFGTQRGELIVLNYMNGAILKSWTPHQLNVSALIYCKEDQCVLTASWDRSLRLYDDNTSANSLLRCVTEAHDADIKCMAYCYAMSLIATGSADGTIKIWDYIYFLLEDTCSLSAYNLEPSDVTALEFVEPYPLLLSCHENGRVCCWNVSPTKASILLFHYAPFLRDPTKNPFEPIHSGLNLRHDEDQKGGVCCCDVFYDESGGEILANDIRKGRFLLVTASLDGEICIDDFSKIFVLFNLKTFRSESLPSNHFGTYNPRRRFIRHGKNAKRLKNHLKHRLASVGENGATGSTMIAHQEVLARIPLVKGCDVVQVIKWRAHQSAVRYLRTVEEPPAILSCSSDKTVRVWSLDGSSLGSLSHSQSFGSTTSDTRNDSPVSGWNWSIDPTSSAQFKRAQAEDIWESMRVQKLKLLARRTQATKMTDRNRRRTTLGLGASASAPSLPTKVSAKDQQQPEHPTNQNHEISMPPETDRLFKQLKGEATWKQSDIQLARKEAWEKERAKFHLRMKRILKKKTKPVSADEKDLGISRRDEDDNEQETSVAHSLKNDFDSESVTDPTTNLLPDNLSSTVQDLPFEDKDNWSVGGLNRQKQMYGNLHHENVRRSQKVLASKGSKLRKIQSMANIDLTPSAFLLERLGPSCIIRDNTASTLKPKPIRNAKKKSAQSMTSLRSSQSLLSMAGSSSLNTSSVEPEMKESNLVPPHQDARSGLPHVRSAPVLVQQPSIKDLFLQQAVVEEKVTRASRLLSRTGTMRQERVLSPLEDIQEHDAMPTQSQLGKPPKPVSATQRISSGDRPSSTGTRVPKPNLRSSGTSTKKLRIRTDSNIMRQDYFGIYSRDDIASLFRTFNTIDKDKSGTITLRELVDGAGLFGSTHLRENVMGIFSSVDKDQSGHIDLQELCGAVFNEAPPEVMQEILHFCSILATAEKAKLEKKRKLSPEQLKELKELFQLYDTDRNGDIDVDELFNALRYNEKFYEDDSNRSGNGGSRDSTSANITREDVERIIARFDINTNSTLDLDEFIELFREEL